MWLTVVMLLAPAFWLNIRAETLVDGLPEDCGRRVQLSPPPEPYDGTKTEAPPHSWPWHVGLYFSGYGAYPYCGGTLIAPTWVLTAAHCISMTLPCVDIPLGWPFTYAEFTNAILVVKVGSHNFNNAEHLAHNVLVKEVIMHPTFPLNGPKKDSDFALLKLTREVKRSQHVGFACLPKTGSKVNDGMTCHVAGWGLIALTEQQWSKQPEVLMEQPATITWATFCEAVFTPPHSTNNICVQQSIATACVGDSGGGLHCPTPDGTWMLNGVLSRVTDRCYGSFVLFGGLDAPLLWIKQMIKAFK